MRRRGADPDVIRSLTGHETLSMLSRYNITDDRDQRAALRTMHAYRQEQDAAPRSLATMPASSKGIN